MKGLIQASLGNPYAVIVMGLTISILGSLALLSIPVDILPVFKSPAVQILTFYGGMPAESIEKDISLRMEKWTGQANGMKRQESRSISGTSIVRNYFQDGQDPNGALTQVNSLIRNPRAYAVCSSTRSRPGFAASSSCATSSVLNTLGNTFGFLPYGSITDRKSTRLNS